jgi:hypothetical protein
MPPELQASISCAPAEIVFQVGGRVHLNRELLPLHVPQKLADRITTIPDRTRRFQVEMKAYIDHLTQAQYRLIATANQWQDNVLEQRIQKGPTKGAATGKSFKFGDWIAIPWDDMDPHPGKNNLKPHKLAPTCQWQGPYKVTGLSDRDAVTR